METFYISETPMDALPNKWAKVTVRTLSAAKSKAQQARASRGTCAHVGVIQSDGSIKAIATRYPENFGKVCGWFTL